MIKIQHFQVPGGERVAFSHQERDQSDTTLVFLPGYMSDMEGGKATALMDWASERGYDCLLLDYSGCGRSDGNFADGSLSKWRDEVLALIDARKLKKVALVGSSMGGWLMLMVGLALGKRLVGMVGIASAPDFTEWGRSDQDKTLLGSGVTVFDDNPYGSEPTPMHAKFWQDGQNNRLLSGEIAIHCPVRLLHGERDADVPHEISVKLAKQLCSDNVQVTLVKDGDHRLSRDSDIKLLLCTVAALLD